MRGTALSGVCENLRTIMTNNGAEAFTLARTNLLRSMIFNVRYFAIERRLVCESERRQRDTAKLNREMEEPP